MTLNNKVGCIISLNLPPNPPGGLSNPLIFNKSPLGDLGVDKEKEANETDSFRVR